MCQEDRGQNHTWPGHKKQVCSLMDRRDVCVEIEQRRALVPAIAFVYTTRFPLSTDTMSHMCFYDDLV
jgi:hypothetical protein